MLRWGVDNLYEKYSSPFRYLQTDPPLLEENSTMYDLKDG